MPDESASLSRFSILDWIGVVASFVFGAATSAIYLWAMYLPIFSIAGAIK